MHSTLLILAAGASSRMKASKGNENLSEEEIKNANSISKALIGLGKDNRPLLDYLLINTEKAGYTSVILIVGEQADSFKQCYGKAMKNNKYKGLNISYATQYIPADRIKPFGTADAVYQALEQYPSLKNESFTVCNCDNLYSVEALAALRSTKAKNALISYNREGLLFSMERIARFALMCFDPKNYLIDIIEKPAPQKTSDYKDTKGAFRVSMNVFKFNGTQFYPYLKSCPVHPDRNEKELPTALLNMCKDDPKAILGIAMNEHVPDLTSKEDIAIMKDYIKRYFGE